MIEDRTMSTVLLDNLDQDRPHTGMAMASILDIPQLKSSPLQPVEFSMLTQIQKYSSFDTFSNPSTPSFLSTIGDTDSELDREDILSWSTTSQSRSRSGNSSSFPPSPKFICDYLQCQEETDKTCQGCQKKSYCSREHQELDWKDHQKECSTPFFCHEVDPKLGWTVRLNFDVKELQVVVSNEEPFVILPNMPSSKSSLICVNCGLVLKMKAEESLGVHPIQNPATCIICHWPACKGGCRFEAELDPRNLHSVQECRVLLDAAKSGLLWNGDPVLYQYLWILRMGLIKQRNPIQFPRMLQLANFNGENPDRKYLSENSIKFLQRYLPYLTKLLTPSELEQIFKIIITKFRPIQFLNTLPYPKKLQALYFESSIISHSCFPNLQYFTDESFRQTLVSLRPIKAGDILSINYAAELTFLPTYERRKYLLDRFNIWCICKRCKHSSEFGTFFSAPPCRSKGDCTNFSFCSNDDNDRFEPISNQFSWTPNSYLRMLNPKDIQLGWYCPNTLCQSSVIPNFTVAEPINKFREEIHWYWKNNYMITLASILKDAYDERMLHPTHYAMFEGSWKLLELLADFLPTIGADFFSHGYYLQFALAAESIHIIFKSFVPKSVLLSSHVLRMVALIRLAILTEDCRVGRHRISFEEIENRLQDIYYTQKQINLEVIRKFYLSSNFEDLIGVQGDTIIDDIEKFGIEMFVKQIDFITEKRNMIVKLRLKLNALKEARKKKESL